MFEGTEMWIIGLLASALAGLATGLGALPILFTRNVSAKAKDVMMGFGAGVMIAASCFSLIVPALENAGGGLSGASVVSFGLILGSLFLFYADKYIPHQHFILGKEGISAERIKKVYLFIVAITIHNFPEGLTVGVGFGEPDISSGISLAIGIGIQNIPEGLVVALSLIAENYSKTRALLIATLTGLVEPVGGLIGVIAVSFGKAILPYGLSFAAGAMLFVVSDEIIPESHRLEHAKSATFGVMFGFIVMMILDNIF